MRKWRLEDSEELYNIKGWGVNYFGINEQGHVYVRPNKDEAQIDLVNVMEDLSVADVTAPVLLRFPDILDNRIEKTAACFSKAEKEYDYQGEHFIVFPIKVNQMRPVVEEIISHGKKYNLGLECGSKPELHAVLATNMDSDSIIVCNGHKDQNFIELALLAQKMGKRVFLVIEKLPELKIIARTAEKLGVRPNLGIRIKLASRGTGKWEESGGDASKFGLNSTELLQALNALDDLGLRDCLKLIHFHIGSQIPKIRLISIALREMAQYYVQLRKMGWNIEFVDCGGGLGVDYDGTRSSNSESSVNYSVQEYVNDIVYTLCTAANENEIPHPNIITEGGRSLTAHHSVLVLEVLETVGVPHMPEDFVPAEDDHKLVHELNAIWDKISSRSMLEDWHDVQDIRDEALELFRHGLLDLRTRAQIESLYWSLCHEISELVTHQKHCPDELRKLSNMMAEKYFCNFSLFQSLPDHWALDQLFPIMPIQRLDERPTVSATLQDISCDSDGKISTYVNHDQQTNYIPLHELKDGEKYYVAVFLVGAYQEILGNMHNLFGDTNAVHISVDGESYSIDKTIDGETVADVLEYVQYDPKHLVRRLETWVSKAVKEKKITPEEGKEFISTYRAGLYGYTYLE